MLIPKTSADVGWALSIAWAAGRKVYVRSGNRIESRDVVADPEAAVVSLEAFTSIDIDLQLVTVGPAAAVGDVANELRLRGLFLPLSDNPTMSMAAAVLGDHRVPFPRSVGDSPLRDGVVEADVVRTEHRHAELTTTLDREGWQAFLKGRAGVVTRIVLDALHWDKYGKNRWLRAWMVPYKKESFAKLCELLFAPPTPELATVDISLRASAGANGERIVVLRSTGQDRDQGERARAFIEGALDAARCTVLWSDKVAGAGASVAAWVGTGPARAEEGELHELQKDDRAWSPGNETAYLDQVDAQVRGGAWVELHAGSLFRRTLTASFAGATAPPIPTPEAARPRLALSSATPTAVTTIAPTHQGDPIPGFEGEVFDRATDDDGYRDAIQQYAVSSFDAATIALRMSPRYVAIPRDATDVVRAVEWAAGQGLKVVARSGGHQYCGLSSGGDDTLLVDVSLLNTVAFSPDGTVTVGPGVPLMTLTKALRAQGVAIPHGECPLVNMGGHVQTGGIGHQLRSLGAALDWVRSFRMVTRDPNGGWAERSYTHLTLGVTGPDDDIFAAMLGGGPASWGVLTSITFAVAKDADYPDSRGYTKNYPYNRAGWAAAFTQMGLWSQREYEGTLPDGLDLFVSVISSDFELSPNTNLRPAVLLLETTALNAAVDGEVQAGISNSPRSSRLYQSTVPVPSHDRTFTVWRRLPKNTKRARDRGSRCIRSRTRPPSRSNPRRMSTGSTATKTSTPCGITSPPRRVS